MPLSPEEQRTRAGLISAVAAYVVWGVSPLFFALLSGIPAIEVVAHRVLWSVLVLALFLSVQGSVWKSLLVLRNPRTLLITTGAAFFVSVNWVIYVFAVTNGFALQASLGYFVLPLISVALGGLFLGERFTRRQLSALVLVIAGVASMMLGVGAFPWVTVSLGLTFAVYGLLRKISPSESLSGLFNETLLLLPLAAGYILILESTGTGNFLAQGWDIRLLLIIGTPLWTALPLFLFGFAARRMKLSTVGLLFYLNPSFQFVIAVFIFREAFTAAHALSFGLIWAGLAVYLWPARKRRAVSDIDGSPSANAYESNRRTVPTESGPDA